MVAVENQGHAATQKRKGRWFRFRFGVRTLLLLTAIVAVLLSVEARRAHDQRQLAARLDALGAEYSRIPRDRIPEFARRMLTPNQTETIVSVSLEGMQVPGTMPFSFRSRTKSRATVSMTLVEPAEIEAVCGMPAMAHVRVLELKGNAVTDDVLDELAAMEHLDKLTCYSTAISNEAMEEWLGSHPDCDVFYRAEDHGLEHVAGAALRITDDLSLFIRADRGEVEAIRKLLHLTGNPDNERPRMLLDFLWRFDAETALPLFTEALETGNGATRQAVAELLDHLDSVDLLRGLLDDPVTSVRVEAVLSLGRINDGAASEALLTAAENSESEVRTVALRELAKTAGRKAMPCYLAALGDSDSAVRWQAIYAIDRAGDRSATAALIESLSDEEPDNRFAAVRALGKVGDSRAAAVLESVAEKDGDPDVRRAAQGALVAVSKRQ